MGHTAQPEEHDPSRLLDASLAEWREYWGEQGQLSVALERWKALEYEMRCNFAAQGHGVPLPWVANDIRSGKWERDRAQGLRNYHRNQVKIAMWRRQGYTFDAERRLVAPPGRQPRVPARPVTVTARPRERARGRSRVTRAGPSDDEGPADPPLLVRGRLGVA